MCMEVRAISDHVTRPSWKPNQTRLNGPFQNRRRSWETADPGQPNTYDFKVIPKYNHTQRRSVLEGIYYGNEESGYTKTSLRLAKHGPLNDGESLRYKYQSEL